MADGAVDDLVTDLDPDAADDALVDDDVGVDLAAVLAAEAALRTARINLDYTRVYAPISGQISQSLMTEGALVSASAGTVPTRACRPRGAQVRVVECLAAPSPGPAST